MMERIWLTWEQQRRNKTLSDALDARLYEFDHPPPRLSRWFKSITDTLSVLYRDSPQIVFAQNPSLVLALIAVWYGRLTGRVAVIDAHNAGIFPFSGRRQWHSRLLRPLMQRLVHHAMRTADLTLVSNAALQAYIEGVGGRAFALPDPLPHFIANKPQAGMSEEPRVLFICTWASDEPYAEVIEAAARIDPRIRILITGNSKGREQRPGRELPKNIVLTGFVPEDEFVRLLHECDLVMDLTTLEDCLVCGAYEAVAAGTPLISSDTRALRSYFHKGVVFARNDAAGIAAAVEEAIARQQELAVEIAELKGELDKDWKELRNQLEAWLSERQARIPGADDLKKL